MKKEDIKLIHKMKNYCIKFHPKIFQYKNLNKAAYSELNSVGDLGKPSKRLMVILVAKGCEWAKSGGPCTMCNYWILRDEKIKDNQLVNQFKSEIAKYNLEKENIQEISIFVSGSFICEREVSINAQNKILKIASEIRTLRKVMVEGRAVHVNKERIMEMKRILGKIKLEIGLGLESSDDFIANVIINKGLTRKIFERAVKIIRDCKVRLSVYVLIKPPFLTEKEAIKDSIETAKYVFKLSKRYGIQTKVDFEPVHIKPFTIVDELYKKKEYSSPWLWSLIEILKKLKRYKYSQVLLSTEGYEWYQKPKNCQKCQDKIVDAINKYNIDNDLSVFEDINCGCKEKWKRDIQEIPKYSLRERVTRFLK